MSSSHPVSPGEPHPLGATIVEGGVNFSVFSANATSVDLLLFERFDDEEPFQIVPLDARHHRTFSYWHALVHGVREGLIYGYQVEGPWDPHRGMRFDAEKVLIDPYARGIVYGENFSHAEACSPGANVESAMKSLVVDPSPYDWQGVEPPQIDAAERIVYELHVRGFTRHPSSRTDWPGTFDALVQKIPYLRELGVTTVELLPIFQFDEGGVPFTHPETGRPLVNFWGYDPLGFFAPHRGYYIEDWEQMRYLTGFRDLVRELHRSGIEVILDVVFNHTAETGENGPTLCFRGLDNSVYYLLDANDRSRYLNFSGTGNTLNCNHPIVRRLILDSLRYWAGTMRVDGFRFDLASVLSRDESGRPMEYPPLPWEIESDPILQHKTLIAEAWDAAGLYQVGHFPGERWSEWNGRFRDDVRRFVRGDADMVGTIAARVLGSPDIYEPRGKDAVHGVNFITCHDGFTLFDLVRYERKHNEENGEQNRDGTDANFSANHGVEGPSSDPAIEALRLRQMKNFLSILFLSQGTPMLLAGDEMGRTQRGNNNAYCQDNEISWVDWGRLERFAGLHRFTREMIGFRARHPSLRRRRHLMGYDAPEGADPPGATRVRWHGREPDQPDFGSASRSLAFTLTESEDDVALHVVLHADPESTRFRLPPAPSTRTWRAIVDTARESPDDVVDEERATPLGTEEVEVEGRSVRVFAAL